MAKLSLAVQYASVVQDLPTKQQFRKWANSALRIDAEIALRIVDEAEARDLNREYRGKDYATNVLTFCLSEEPHLIGDIVFCAPVVMREAQEQNKTPEAHFAQLTVHGVLHLHGYDHEIEAQAELMETLETEIVMQLGYPDPYLSEKEAAQHG